MAGYTDLKVLWMHPETYFMLVKYNLLNPNLIMPFLGDKLVMVNKLMPRTGMYDEPTRRLKRILNEIAQDAGLEETAA